MARALRSVFEQDHQGGVEVIVVDDESPAPARAEIGGLPSRPDIRLEIIEQSNQGCGPARNTGLDAASPGTKYFAVLDSDDAWSPDHLSRAVEALEHGHDFYFANWIPLGEERDAHSLLGRIDFSLHERADWSEEMWIWKTDFFRQELEQPVGRVSTNVWRRDGFGDLRYLSLFSNCCEDIFFRLEVAKRSASVVFSSRVELFSGEGVNIFSASGWGTPDFLKVARDQIRFLDRVNRSFELTGEERALLRRKRTESRRAAAGNLLNLIRRGERIPMPVLRSLLSADPGVLMSLPGAVLRGMGARLG